MAQQFYQHTLPSQALFVVIATTVAAGFVVSMTARQSLPRRSLFYATILAMIICVVDPFCKYLPTQMAGWMVGVLSASYLLWVARNLTWQSWPDWCRMVESVTAAVTRRPFQFRLSTIFWVTALVAVICAIFVVGR